MAETLQVQCRLTHPWKLGVKALVAVTLEVEMTLMAKSFLLVQEELIRQQTGANRILFPSLRSSAAAGEPADFCHP